MDLIVHEQQIPNPDVEILNTVRDQKTVRLKTVLPVLNIWLLEFYYCSGFRIRIPGIFCLERVRKQTAKYGRKV
jgi:hypothetical protein